MTDTARKMTAAEFVQRVTKLVRSGKLDPYLEVIREACFDRMKANHERLKWENMERLNQLGKQVRVIPPAKPQYLLGAEGMVVDRPSHFRKSEGVIYVDFGRVYGKGRTKYGPIVGVPAACLEEA